MPNPILIAENNGVKLMVHKRLRDARLRRGMTQAKLALLLDFEGYNLKGAISNYETGKHTPAFQIVKTIAKILDYPECYFYIEDDAFAEQVLALYRGTPPEKITPYAKEIKQLKNDILSLARYTTSAFKDF